MIVREFTTPSGVLSSSIQTRVGSVGSYVSERSARMSRITALCASIPRPCSYASGLGLLIIGESGRARKAVSSSKFDSRCQVSTSRPKAQIDIHQWYLLAEYTTKTVVYSIVYYDCS